MSIVGFNFTKISAERKKAVVGQINISNNITIKDVAETKLGIATKGAIRVSFQFTSTYAPDFATLQFEGDVIVLVDSKQSDDLLAGWKASRRLPNVVAEPLMNHVLDRCNLQALIVAKDLNLPSPVPLPKVRVSQSEAPKTETPKTKVKKGK